MCVCVLVCVCVSVSYLLHSPCMISLCWPAQHYKIVIQPHGVCPLTFGGLSGACAPNCQPIVTVSEHHCNI